MVALMMYRIGVNREEVLHGPSVTQQQVTTCLILWRNFSHGDFGDCRSGPRFDIYSWHIPSESAVNKILGGKRRGLPRRLFDITSSKGHTTQFGAISNFPDRYRLPLHIRKKLVLWNDVFPAVYCSNIHS
jgi:hypothetical protein